MQDNYLNSFVGSESFILHAKAQGLWLFGFDEEVF